MAQQLARTETVLSPSLRRALDRIATEQPGAALSISSQTRADAEAALAAIERALEPAPRETVERWIEALGALTAAPQGEDEAARKTRAYAAMLEFPASAFSRRSLDAAARRFRFFPSYAELTEHLEAETADLKTTRHQLRRAVALPIADHRPVGKWSAMTPEQREEFDRLMEQAREALRSPAAVASTTGGEIGALVSETGPTL